MEDGQAPEAGNQPEEEQAPAAQVPDCHFCSKTPDEAYYLASVNGVSICDVCAFKVVQGALAEAYVQSGVLLQMSHELLRLREEQPMVRPADNVELSQIIAEENERSA